MLPSPANAFAFKAKGKAGLRRKMDEMAAICQQFPGIKVHEVGAVVRREAMRMARYLELEG